MGLLDSLLEVPERLRVWQMAGVRHFYIDPEAVPAVGDSPAPESASVEDAVLAAPKDVVGQAEPAVEQVETTVEGHPMAPTTPPAPETPQASPSTVATSDPPSQALSARLTPPTPPQPSQTPQDSPTGGRAALPDNPDRWPLPWPTFFAKTPPTPRLVITYRELGLDMAGQSEPRRRDLWRRLIAEAGLAGKGLVAFWPLALPQGGALTEMPLHFACGVARLNPELVAVFGEISDLARQELATRAASTLTVLPPPHALYNPDPEVWEHVIATLRRS
ncbi:MAG: hypothetical protein B193_1760 [Solidesulfovibrio magneticus str. Maddingley MBC34]|uniref:Uncharacterized protein n=1 Tax=Solidesulfovibrio magneticus str. Maddingley MBC34 TaxID=1206767 RepID=K6GEM4_9BACT|nr:MAG: hypothetical protein B193_1760 [Solidesulfovibrio magneticus str. Maddingley MBC34]